MWRKGVEGEAGLPPPGALVVPPALILDRAR